MKMVFGGSESGVARVMHVQSLTPRRRHQRSTLKSASKLHRFQHLFGVQNYPELEQLLLEEKQQHLNCSS